LTKYSRNYSGGEKKLLKSATGIIRLLNVRKQQDFGIYFTFLNKKKLHKNSRKILTVFRDRKTVEDGQNQKKSKFIL